MANQLGYVEEGAAHIKVGCGVGVIDVYRIRKDKINEVKGLIKK